MSNPTNISGIYQRTVYKLIDRLLTRTQGSARELLTSLIQELVDSESLVVTGGRLWQLADGEDVYTLLYQYGSVEQLEPGFRRPVAEYPILTELASKRLIVTQPEESKHNQDVVYSLTGVGELQERPAGSLFPFVLGLTGSEDTDEFVDTMVVVGAAATNALRTMGTDARQEQIQRDLVQAWEIQRGLVPEHSMRFAQYDMYGISLPDSVVGGDYFDYLKNESDEDRLGIVISDAASKGMPAAIQALFVSGAIKMGFSFQTKISSLISRLNTLIYDAFPNERFVSLFYCELTDSANGLILYCNAGHPAPLHYQRNVGETKFLQPTGGILGIVSEQPFRVENINMDVGDSLILYTDGITEAQNRRGELYGEERMINKIKQAAGTGTAADIAKALIQDVEAYSAGAGYSDDKTIVIIRRR